jgi:hypothetical protein
VASNAASRRYQGTGALSLASFIPGQMCASPSHTRGRSPVPGICAGGVVRQRASLVRCGSLGEHRYLAEQQGKR